MKNTAFVISVISIYVKRLKNGIRGKQGTRGNTYTA